MFARRLLSEKTPSPGDPAIQSFAGYQDATQISHFYRILIIKLVIFAAVYGAVLVGLLFYPAVASTVRWASRLAVGASSPIFKNSEFSNFLLAARPSGPPRFRRGPHTPWGAQRDAPHISSSSAALVSSQPQPTPANDRRVICANWF
jgi:hypothetical protein